MERTVSEVGPAPPRRFRTPEEEIAYLRERVRERGQELELKESAFERGRLLKREVRSYAEASPEDYLADNYRVPEHEVLRSALGLKEEEHDAQVSELLRLVSERGVKNALSIAARMNNPHVEDDLHRALVRYVAEGLPAKGLSEGGETWRSLSKTLFEIHPHADRTNDTNSEQSQKGILSKMEQLYAGFLAMIEEENNTFTMEIAVPEGSESATFFISVPTKKKQMFERHVLSIFPSARVAEVREDYNIFNAEGEHAAAYATLSEHPALPIKTYEAFGHDPMGMLLSAFSRIAKHGEGAALQFVVGTSGDHYNKHYAKIGRALSKGMSLSNALKIPETALGEVARDFGAAFFGGAKKDDAPKERTVDGQAVERVVRKYSTRIVPVTIRAVVSARTDSRAEELLDNVTSTFNQFDDAASNRLRFSRVKGGKMRTLLRNFSFRTFEVSRATLLNIAELATIYHLTTEKVDSSRELKQAYAKQAPAPIDMPESGIVLGINRFGGAQTYVRFAPEDRLRHFYCVGQTGTGKTTLIKNMVIQDIRAGDGVCFIDPHGSDIVDILAAVPEERREDIVYFDPAYTERVMGLNMLEYDISRPEQKTFVVNELLAIFEKLYEKSPEGLGPMFQQYFRNAAMLVVEDPASGNTLIEIPRVLSDSAFRQHKLSRCGNPLVVQFWRNIAEQAGGEASLENVVPYITSKTDVFLANDIIRPIVAQEKSAFHFREMIDGKKIFLANLSKGRIGDTNAELLGLILVGKFLKAALSRADSPGAQLPVFHLYIDEFQNFTTPSIATILSEARKYKLTLNVAHQFISQLREEIKNAVFGNVGTKCVFRVGAQDAEELVSSFAPVFDASDIGNLDNFNAYLSLLVDGKPARPFNIETIQPDQTDTSAVDLLKEASYRLYGRPREEVEREIRERFDPHTQI